METSKRKAYKREECESGMPTIEVIMDPDSSQKETNLGFVGTNMDIDKVCRGCLEIKDLDDMKDRYIDGNNIITIYEELTKTKLNTTTIQATMCPECIQQLSKAYQFIESLQLSNKLLEKAAQEIEDLKNIEILDSDIYNDKKMKILQNIVKVKSNSPARIDCGAQTDIFPEKSHAEKPVDEGVSDGVVGDNLSDQNDNPTSDEIPLAEKCKIKVVASSKLKEVKETNKDSPSTKNPTKITGKKDEGNKKDSDSTETSDGTQNLDKNKRPDSCPVCGKKVRYFLKHLQSVHSIDWNKDQCLKCLYENSDNDILIEHCKKCIGKKKPTSKTDHTYSEKAKAKSKEEKSDEDNDTDIKTEDPDSEDMEEEESEEKSDRESRKRRRPQRGQSKPDKFECKRCNEVCDTYEGIEAHFKVQHKTDLKCILCNQEYSTTFRLLYHMMVKHGKLHSCKLCLVSFKNLEELNKHYESDEHNQNMCTICALQFNSRKAYSEHRRKKHNPRTVKQKFKCSECPKEFANHYNIRRHIMVAHNDMRYICDTCGQGYTTKRCLLIHVQKFHEGKQVIPENKKNNFFCEECGWKLKIYHKYTVAVHLARHKGHNYVCRKCYETFELEEQFKIHLEELGHQLYECKKCQSQFMTEENYKTHVQNHDIPKIIEPVVYECIYCPKSFKTKQMMENHVRVHTNERPFKCQACGKGFKTWIHRKAHMDIHLGIKKYICKYCSKAFTNSGTMKAHEMIHTGERPHKCPECEKGFTTTSAMKKHRLTHIRMAGKKGIPIKIDEDNDISDSEVKEETAFVYEYEQGAADSDDSHESKVADVIEVFEEELEAEEYLEAEDEDTVEVLSLS